MPPRLSVSKDGGAAGVEVAGITLLVAAFMAAAVSTAALTTPSVIGEGVSSICRAFEQLGASTGECADLGAYDDASPTVGTPVEEV